MPPLSKKSIMRRPAPLGRFLTFVRHRWLSYTAALVIAIVAYAVMLFLNDTLHDRRSPFLLLFAAVAITTRLGGMGPGIFTTILLTMACDYSFIPPLRSFFFTHLTMGTLEVAIVFSECLIICSITAALRRAKMKAEHANQRLEAEEQRLRESEERFRLLALAAREHALYTLDQDGRITAWNQGAVRLTGYERDEALHRHVSFLYKIDDPRADTIEDELAEALAHARAERQRRLVRNDDRVVWVLSTTSTVIDNRGGLAGFTTLISDLSRLKANEEALEKSKNFAEAANRAKDLVLANVSHELRTPLTAIMGFSEMLSEAALPAPYADSANRVHRNATYLLSLVDDLLDLARLEHDKLRLETRSCAPDRLLADVVSLLDDRARRKGVAIQISLDPALPETVSLDSRRLRQILINIIGNAVKFTNQGFVTVHAKASAHGMLAFTVKDTGVGITPAQAQLLFMPFSQGDASASRSFGGTGLGLAISRRLALAMGGNVELIDSVPGQGSTFRITVQTGTEDDAPRLNGRGDDQHPETFAP